MPPPESLPPIPVPLESSNLPKIPRRKPDSAIPPAKRRRVSRSRSPIRSNSEARRNNRRSPPPERVPSRSPSPPRVRKRPGAASRIDPAARREAQRLQNEREALQNTQDQARLAARGVHDVVRQHYNLVPERGREWRKTDSKIKGLRSFNNWIKSAVIQKFSPSEDYTRHSDNRGGGGGPGILVLDMGCGKGGDLQKWQQAPQRVDLYVGVDPAEVSIEQARERYQQMTRRRGPRGTQHIFDGQFYVQDAFGEYLGNIPVIQEVGIDPSVGPEGAAGGFQGRFGGGGFDVVTMMFYMHYAFESEAKARGMLRNVAGALKKGGRFLGVIPNSDIISSKVEEWHKGHAGANGNGGSAVDDGDDWDPEKTLDTPPHATQADEEGEVKQQDPVQWGNSIYTVKIPSTGPNGLPLPQDGVFRPPFGWKYSYFLEEAVEGVPEYVVPWEAFRALAEDYNLELQYRSPFPEIWESDKDDPVLGPLSERMGVRSRDGRLLVSPEELDAAGFYHAFCFYKV
ncbi:mRNA capping enzyme-domain-containing protein [Cryomyces antarcticus]